MKPWDGIIPPHEQEAYRAAGFGRSSGLGTRPCLLIIDVQYRTVGTTPKPFMEAIKEFPTACGQVGWDGFTRTGQFMVGVADNPDRAALYGINKRQIFLVTMLISGVLTGLGMFLYGTRAQVLPQSGVNLMLFAVAATIIGGIGNLAGAAIAAVILGIIQNASILVISSEWQGFLLYVFLFLAIVFFPSGLRLPKRRSKFATATRALPSGPAAPPAASQA